MCGEIAAHSGTSVSGTSMPRSVLVMERNALTVMLYVLPENS